MIIHLYRSSCRMQFTSLEMYWLLVHWIILYDWVQRQVKRPVISSNADELEIVLAKASMPNKMLIMTIANRGWMEPNDLIDLLLESFHIGEGTQGLLDYLLIVALDEKDFNRYKEIHPHCYDLRTKGVDFSGEKVDRVLALIKPLIISNNFIIFPGENECVHLSIGMRFKRGSIVERLRTCLQTWTMVILQ